MNSNRVYEKGAVSISVVLASAMGFLALVFAALALWAFLSYNEQKTNVDGKIQDRVVIAKKEASDEEFKKYQEELEKPYTEFVGPDDYGRLTFTYPKTWSAYVSKDVSGRGGNFEAYMHPGVVPPATSGQKYALRVSILETDYDRVLRGYSAAIKKGDLRSSATSSNGESGTRLDGQFSKDIRGAAVIYKIRDKTLVIRTDANTFKPKFEEIIKTIKFNN